jgi:hypothetical protein
VAHLQVTGTGELTEMVGDALDEGVAVPAETSSGTSVPKVTVPLTIVGDTDTALTGGESVLQ